MRKMFLDLFDKFQRENKLLDDHQNGMSYLQNKRVIAIVDRRSYNIEEKPDVPVYMFEPPQITRNIPENSVPEWYFGASKLCLLPAVNFGDGSQYLDHSARGNFTEPEEESVEMKLNETNNANFKANVKELNAQKKQLEQDKIEKYKNIGAGFGCGGSILTLSFHVKQENVIKLYLYCNGQSIRFMPEDIRNVLPLLFDMEYPGNKEFLNRHDIVQSHIDHMRRGLVDEEFMAFQQTYM